MTEASQIFSFSKLVFPDTSRFSYRSFYLYFYEADSFSAFSFDSFGQGMVT